MNHPSRRRPATRAVRAVALESLESRTLCSTTFYVSLKGNDANAGTSPTDAWRHIQYAFDVATPGSTVDVLAGTYHEKLTLNVSGNATDGFITFEAVGKVTIDGQGIAGSNIIAINNENYVQIEGFNICNNLNVNNGSGIRLTEADNEIQILNNRIYNITGTRAMGITVYGTDPTNGISNVTISGNDVYHCNSYPSETITLNGNVYNFTVTNNYVHNVGGIGIDCIGGEGMSPNPLTDFARDGTISGNQVTGARSAGVAVGIMIDGAQDIVVAQNKSWNNQIGIEIGCVHPNALATNDTVRDNLVYSNRGAGISIGGSDSTEGFVTNCQVSNNTLYHNDADHSDDGSIRIQQASDNLIENNLVDGTGGTPLIASMPDAGTNTSDYNLFFSPGGKGHALFVWAGKNVVGLSSWQSKSADDANSIFAAPIFAPSRTGYLKLFPRSPGINLGNPLVVASGETDFAGQPREMNGLVDIGAYEVG